MFFATLLFFGLTRTMAGREGVRKEIEDRFRSRFAGSIQIGHLSGNLVYDFLAENVSLFDPQGKLIGHIDTVRAEPTWESLISRQLKLRSIDLRGVVIDLERDVNNRWNVAEAVRPTAPSDSARSAFSLIAPDVRISRASVKLRNRGSTPRYVRNGTFADYLNETLILNSARFVVDWEGNTKQLDVINLEGSLPARDIDVRRFQSQVVLEEGTLALNEFSLTTAGSRIEITGTYTKADSLSDRPPSFDADLKATPLSNQELSQLVPALRARDAVVLDLHVGGTGESIVLNNASIARGRSAIQAAGIFDLRNDSLLADLGFSSPHVNLNDLSALFPSASLRSLTSVDSAKGEIWIQARAGISDLFSLDANIQTDLESSSGSISATGSAGIRKRALSNYSVTGAFADVDLASLSGQRLPASKLTGNVDIVGDGYSLSSLAGQYHAALSKSDVYGISIDSMSATLVADNGRLALSTELRQTGSGRASAEAEYITTGYSPVFSATIRSLAFDFGRLVPSASFSTSVNGTVIVAGDGQSPRDLQGRVTVRTDSSTIVRGERISKVGPIATTLDLKQAPGSGLRANLSGSPLVGAFRSDVTLDRLAAGYRHWRSRIHKYATSISEKRYADRNRTTILADSLFDSAPFANPASDDSVRASFSFHFEAVDPGLIAAGLFVAGDATRLGVAGSGEFDRNRLLFNTNVTADSLALDSFAATDLEAVVTAQMNPATSMARSLAVDATVHSNDARVGRQTFARPSLSIRHREGTGSYRLQTDQGPRVGPIDVRAQLTTLGPSNRLIVNAARVVAGDYKIGLSAPNYVDVYTDAVVAHSFELSSQSVDGTLQRLLVDGAYSAEPSDTLHVVSENIELDQLSEFLALRERLGGILNGRAALTQRETIPALSGTAEIAELSLGERLLGDLNVNAQFLRGTPDVSIEASLRPIEGIVQAREKVIARNDLNLSGQVTFANSDFGPRLALDVDIQRADLFFFEYIFPHTIEAVTGMVSGTGTISGTWVDPVFEADLKIVDGSFSIPDFNLDYLIDGEVSVDESGVHVADALLRDGSGGTAMMNGSVLFNDYRYFSLDLQAELANLEIMNVDQSNQLPFFGHIWASGTTVLTGPISEATLRSANAQTSANSVLFIPLTEVTTTSDASFIVFADSSGSVPEDAGRRSRRNVLDSRPVGERTFLDGLSIDLNLFAPQGSTVNLVIDPLLGDVMNAVGTGRVQIIRREGEFTTFGSFEVNSGDYLFTAGDVFVRRFAIDSGGSLTWDGNPTNAILDVPASYRTRASAAGLPGAESQTGTIPLIVRLQITGRVATPEVTLTLEVDRTNRGFSGSYQALEAILNQPARATEYATSVLVTNSFLLTTSDANSNALASSAFNSVSQLVASQINRYLNEALPNVDFSFGVQGESAQELGVTYGIALRLLDERLVIRGRGVYQGGRTDALQSASNQGIEGEFVVELRLSKTVSVEAFYRREGDVLTETATTTGSTGAGVSYQTEFSSWRHFFQRLFGISDRDSNATASTK